MPYEARLCQRNNSPITNDFMTMTRGASATGWHMGADVDGRMCLTVPARAPSARRMTRSADQKRAQRPPARA